MRTDGAPSASAVATAIASGARTTVAARRRTSARNWRSGSASRSARRQAHQEMMDCRSAVATACVRVSASSFVIALRTCVRTVSGEMLQPLADLLVREPVGEQAQHLALARRQRREPFVRGGR